MKYVNSYDEDAPLPGVGSIWVWELDSPSARALIEVTDVFWNGEEWWVKTVTLLPPTFLSPSGGEHVNDVGRFWEACTPVRLVHSSRPPLVARTA